MSGSDVGGGGGGLCCGDPLGALLGDGNGGGIFTTVAFGAGGCGDGSITLCCANISSIALRKKHRRLNGSTWVVGNLGLVHQTLDWLSAAAEEVLVLGSGTSGCARLPVELEFPTTGSCRTGAGAGGCGGACVSTGAAGRVSGTCAPRSTLSLISLVTS